jgi:hypothetical protein
MPKKCPHCDQEITSIKRQYQRGLNSFLCPNCHKLCKSYKSLAVYIIVGIVSIGAINISILSLQINIEKKRIEKLNRPAPDPAMYWRSVINTNIKFTKKFYRKDNPNVDPNREVKFEEIAPYLFINYREIDTLDKLKEEEARAKGKIKNFGTYGKNDSNPGKDIEWEDNMPTAP